MKSHRSSLRFQAVLGSASLQDPPPSLALAGPDPNMSLDVTLPVEDTWQYFQQLSLDDGVTD